MKTTIFAILRNGHTGVDVQRVELCTVILDEGRMSADRYNRIKRQMFNTVENAPKAHHWRLETAEGWKDTFGGYPADMTVRFVKFPKVEVKRAIFCRKPVNLESMTEDLREIWKKRGNDRYYIAAEKHLSADEWKKFTGDLLDDQDWIADFSTQNDPIVDAAAPCIRVTGEGTDIALIVNPEGYTYARYVAIEREGGENHAEA